jgi:hypothetical protein
MVNQVLVQNNLDREGQQAVNSKKKLSRQQMKSLKRGELFQGEVGIPIGIKDSEAESLGSIPSEYDSHEEM